MDMNKTSQNILLLEQNGQCVVHVEGLEHKSDMSNFCDFEISVLCDSFNAKVSFCINMITLLFYIKEIFTI